MVAWLRAVVVFVWSLFRCQADLARRVAALEAQLEICLRHRPRPRLRRIDRIAWVLLRRWWAPWREALKIVNPQTVVGWHRLGHRLLWWQESKPGRPPVAPHIQRLIRRLALDNPGWGAPRIRDELHLLGVELAKSTIERYIPKRGPAGSGGSAQSWLTFLPNHAPQIAAVDFFTVPTLGFRTLYVWVVILHGDRQLARVAVTRHPTALWTAGQLDQALAGRDDLRYLIRDNDRIYGQTFRDAIAAHDLRDRPTARASPWQNGIAERAIGTLKRELTDHLIPLSEAHLQRHLDAYVEYYNYERPHQGLGGQVPSRARQPEPEGRILRLERCGGLHSRYTRVAA